MLTRETLLQPMQRKVTTYTLSTGEQVTLRNLNELERSAFANASLVKDEQGNVQTDLARMRAQPRRLLVLCVVDPETREPVLSEADIPALGKTDGGVVAEIAALCRKHCGLDAAETAVETAEKNSEPTPALDLRTA